MFGLILTCHSAEYQIGSECCPKCLSGSRVKTHCNEYGSTSCLPCMDGTFTDQPNGLERCIPCTNCDSAGSGRMVKKRCTATSDTDCAPLEGFYCVSSVGLSCDIAQKHKRCKPGQYISQHGTASTDTECSDCSSGTFSNGTFHSCQPHTQCHLFNLQLVTAGTSAADAQCGERSFNVGAAVGGAVGMAIKWTFIIYGTHMDKMESISIVCCVYAAHIWKKNTKLDLLIASSFPAVQILHFLQ
uniref:TNFR-Cys domain-containing protein n=1 Tax=Maylandia zebra TaxID=106582 RepID=A0A3P9BY08_9CICH